MATISAKTIMSALDLLSLLPCEYERPHGMWVEKNGDIHMEWYSCRENCVTIVAHKGKIFYYSNVGGCLDYGEIDVVDSVLLGLLKKGEFTVDM